MKLLKKLSKDSKLNYFLVFLPLALLLLSLVVDYKNENIYVLSNRIPIVVGKNTLLTLNKYFLNIMVSFTSYFIIIIFSALKEDRKKIISIFPVYLFLISNISIFLIFGYIPVFKSLFYFILNIFIIYGFLILIEKMFNSSPLSSIIILFFQLIGGGIVYLYEFKDFFNNILQKLIIIIYSILPIYSKVLAVFDNGNFKILIFNILICAIVFIIETFAYVKK